MTPKKRDISPADHQSNTNSKSPYASNKRKKTNHHSSTAKPSFVDTTSGQKFFFPCDFNRSTSTVNRDADLEFEDESAAIAYLCSVRDEATTIPHVLGVSFQTTQQGSSLIPEPLKEATRKNSYGFYEDGAYTSYGPIDLSISDDVKENDTDSHPAHLLAEAYYQSIQSRYHDLRQQLSQEPPTPLVSQLPSDYSPYVAPLSEKVPTNDESLSPVTTSYTLWTERLRVNDPNPVQLASMHYTSAFRLLRILQGRSFMRPGRWIQPRSSRWLWALLTRIPDAGILGHTEIGWLRDLGKRAIGMMDRALQSKQDVLARDPQESSGNFPSIGAFADTNNLFEAEKDDDGDDGYEGEVDLEYDDDGASTTSSSVEEDKDIQGSKRYMCDHITSRASIEGRAESSTESLDSAKSRLLQQMQQQTDVATPEQNPLPLVDAHGSDTTLVFNSSDQSKIRFDDTLGSNTPSDVTRSYHDLARLNTLHTLNMVISIVGENYGQRDLLPCRKAFI